MSAYYLGSAESPTADFLQVWLKSSHSGDVASRACSPQVTWRLRPPSLYGRRLSRTVPAVVPARLAKISAPFQILCARLDFHYFLRKSQKSISASKCPITAPKIRIWSQKLSKSSCITFKLLNGGRPRFWPRLLKTVQIQQWGVRGWCLSSPPPPHPRTPHAGFDQFSVTSAKSQDSLYLGGQKCCS